MTETYPAITTQPVSQSVASGSSVTFIVVATGGQLTYQWYFIPTGSTTAQAISGAIASTYTISSATTTNAGGYYVVTGNDVQSLQSTTATLTITG